MTRREIRAAAEEAARDADALAELSDLDVARQFADGLPALANDPKLFERSTSKFEWRLFESWSTDSDERQLVVAERTKVSVSYLGKSSCATFEMTPAMARAQAAELVAAADAAERA